MKFFSKVLFSFFIAPIIKYRYKILLKNFDDPLSSQSKILSQIIRNLSSTQFGKDHNLNTDSSYSDFTKCVQTQTYQSLNKYLVQERSKNINTHSKTQALLNPEAIKWEVTSGSSEARKEIPYNEFSLRDFRDLVIYWLGDIIQSDKNISVNKIFFSLSAHLDNGQSDIEDDTDYLPWYLRFFFKDFLLMPRQLKSLKDNHAFNMYLCSELLLDNDLDTLFIWSPTYFLSLIHFINDHQDELIKNIEQGFYLFENKKYLIQAKNPRSIDQIKKIIETNQWNEIRYISCWTEGSAKFFLEELISYFPNAIVQGKGLIATEAPLTFPSFKTESYLPLIDNLFYEFKDNQGIFYRLHELQLNHEYEMFISNRSGLIRYALGDIIKVDQFYHKTPCLKFLKRAGQQSDLTGEKLSLTDIENALNNINNELKAFVIPVIDSPCFYLCCFEGEFEMSSLDDKLRESFHYNESRSLNQLNEIKCVKVESIIDSYNDIRQKQGLKLGDIKFQTLVTKPIAIKDLNEVL